MSDPIRVLIVDDHPVVREGLHLMLETSPDFEVAGDAADGHEALRAAAELHPDVVLMDLRLPGMNGAEATRRIAAIDPRPAVVVLTTYDEDALVLEAVFAGAIGFLRKDCHLPALHAALRSAARGESTIPRSQLSQALAYQRSQTSRPQLTDRETEVLLLVAVGQRNHRIGGTLGITERTVRGHLSSIYTKLGVESRTAAVARAREHGLLA
jgi:DNA-binding NarL/FixJ family response regulator